MKLAAVAILIVILNLPFGYWRSSAGRFSWAWFAAIHIPIPFVIALRLGLFGWDLRVIAVFVAAYVAGQAAGARVKNVLASATGQKPSSSLVRDVCQYWRQRKNASLG